MVVKKVVNAYMKTMDEYDWLAVREGWSKVAGEGRINWMSNRDRDM